MIHFQFSVDNPWHKPTEQYADKTYLYKGGSLSKNKSWEIQAYKTTNTSIFFDFKIDLCWRGRDHAGPEFEICLFGYIFVATIYDNRHWNKTKNDWT